MSVDTVTALPSNILTKSQYEEQQAELLSKEDDLDRTAFLTLFTTQLKNQNPLDPMDNEAFVSQLAQFSSLEAMTGVRASVEDMAADTKSDKFLLGSSLIGKRIERVSTLVTRQPGQPLESVGQLLADADSGVFNVYDAKTDELVSSEKFGQLRAGKQEFSWDGLDAEGEEIPAAQYRVEFLIDKDGQTSAVPLINRQLISAVSWDQSNESLQIEVEDGSVLGMAEVERIEN